MSEDWMNPNDSDPTVLTGADIIKTMKIAKEKSEKKPERKWTLTAFKAQAVRGMEKTKNLLIGIKVKF